MGNLVWEDKIFIIFLISTFLIYILFYLLSARYLTRAIANDGCDNPIYLKIPGGPCIEYSIAIIAPKKGAKNLEQIMNASLIRKHARPLDKLLAFLLLSSLILLFLTLFII